MRLRLWHVLAGIAVLCLAYVVRGLVVPGEGYQASQDVFGGAVGFVLCAVLAVVLARRTARSTAFDHAGPVAAQEDPARPGRWTLEEIGAALASRLAAANPRVHVHEPSGTIRLMLDPPSAFTMRTPRRSPGWGTDRRAPDDSPFPVGEWWEIRWRQGRAPSARHREGGVSPGLLADGRLGPIWGDGPDGGRRVSAPLGAGHLLASAGHREPIVVEMTSARLGEILDEVALRSGWATEAQLTDPHREPLPDWGRTVRREASLGEDTTSLEGLEVDGGPEPGTHRVERRTTSPDGSRTTVVSSPGSGMPERIGPGAMGAGLAGPARVMTWIGIGIVLACVLATGIGLIAGMVWWASFIIIGGGLVFCLIFVLPVVLLARSGGR